VTVQHCSDCQSLIPRHAGVMRSVSCCRRGDRDLTEVQMCSWASFYQGLANEARQRAARASNPSSRDKFERLQRNGPLSRYGLSLGRTSPRCEVGAGERPQPHSHPPIDRALSPSWRSLAHLKAAARRCLSSHHRHDASGDAACLNALGLPSFMTVSGTALAQGEAYRQQLRHQFALNVISATGQRALRAIRWAGRSSVLC
jgi:hypothetical protein